MTLHKFAVYRPVYVKLTVVLRHIFIRFLLC